MADEAIPYYTPGGNLSGYASAAITAKRFVMISGARTNDIEDVSDSVTGGNIQVSQATAGSRPIGVAGEDTAITDLCPILASPGMIVPVTAAGTITAGASVSVTTDGKAIASSNAAATYATVDSSGSAGANNQLRYTAKDVGVIGNGISVRLRDPAGLSAALSITVNGNDIVVNLATDGAGVVTSTATLVKAAIEANGSANAMITVAHVSPSTGAGVVVAEATPKQLANGAEAAASYVAGISVETVSVNEDAQVRLY